MFGMNWDVVERELMKHADGASFRPDEIWITSIMTYWWESTRDRLTRLSVFSRRQYHGYWSVASIQHYLQNMPIPTFREIQIFVMKILS